MTDLSEAAQKIFAHAEANEGRHLLPYRRRRWNDFSPPDDLDREYDASEELVSSGYARWMSGRFSPGIILTGKPLPNPPHPPSA